MNLKTGKWTFYDKYGEKIREQMFKSGRPDGKTIEYFANGKVSSTGTYDDSKRVGQWVYYDQEGKVVHKVTFDKNGKKINELKP